MKQIHKLNLGGVYLLIHDVDQSKNHITYDIWDDEKQIEKKKTTIYLINKKTQQVIIDNAAISFDFFQNVILEDRNEKYKET